MPITERTDNVRAHADINTDHPTPYMGIGDAYKHIPRTSTVAMFKTVIENFPDSEESQT
jgi:hypothetical protein